MKRLKKALAGAPGAVLVGGEAGIGKTRLLREFAASVQARVLTGGCVELGSDGLPFAPFTAALRRLVREIGVEGVQELLPGSKGLARLLPEFGDPDETTGESQARLFELVLTLLERLAPAVLVIEDAHWADRSSRDLLAFLIRNLNGPLLIVVTFRADELHRSHPLRPLLAELERVDQVSRLELARLSRADIGRLLGQLLDADPGPSLIEEIYRRSEGNPLYAEALLEAQGEELPESLRDLLLAGVQRLPEETQEILRVASAGGAHLDHRLLSSALGLEELAMSRALRPAVEANVLVVDGDGYSFRHALIREAIHDDLLPGELTRLHTAYAEALEKDPGLVADGRVAGELAYHWYAAHDLPRALESAWRAAEVATKSAAHAEALSMLERILELWEKVPSSLDHSVVLERAVAAAEHTGKYERGVKLATAALKEVTDPARAAVLLELRGRMALALQRPEGAEDLRAAVRLIPAEPPTSARARALAELATQLFKLSEVGSEPFDAAAEAVRVASAVGDATAELSARITLAVKGSTGEYDDRLEALNQLDELAERADAYPQILRLDLARSHVLQGAGRHEEAVTVARLGIAQADEFGLGRTTGTIMGFNTAEPLVSLGRWDEALQVLDQVRERNPLRRHLNNLHGLTGEVHLARGDLATAETCLNAAWATTHQGGTRRCEDLFPVIRLEAALRLAQGRPDLVLAVIQPVLEPSGLDEDRYGWPVLVLGARACRDAAELAPLEARAKELGTPSPLLRAHKLAFWAETARVHGEKADWDAVAAAWAALKNPYPQAQALIRAAENMTGAERAARLRQAQAIAAELGAQPLLDHVRTRPAGGLTQRETEVLSELALGKTNKEIAETLFISAKTASVHVSNILAKLGVATRGEAAAAAREVRALLDSFCLTLMACWRGEHQRGQPGSGRSPGGAGRPRRRLRHGSLGYAACGPGRRRGRGRQDPPGPRVLRPGTGRAGARRRLPRTRRRRSAVRPVHGRAATTDPRTRP
jgi:DNA-binding CsgD family transcriptional regulator/tetratricopeptide (TPR) repeat protein